MTDKELFKLALDALESCTPLDTSSSHVIYPWYDEKLVDKAITALKERLAQEKALQALHNENERLGLYKDAYVAKEPVALVIDGVLVKSSLPEKYTGHLYTTPPAQPSPTQGETK